MNSELIGEVIASNTVSFSAVVKSSAYEDLPVKFGELVKTETNGMKIFGIVSLIEHTPTELNRKVTPHGKSKAELKREMPQVFELLQTEFRALIVGYEAQQHLYPLLPPIPPDLHDFAFLTNQDEQRKLCSKAPLFLRTILSCKDVYPDELLIAFLRNYYECFSQPLLIAIGKELSHLLGENYRRLETILSLI